jgi:bifunctional N-acetylglucosamine-1-phosphate-uridyltransferase/glucosamine-1-phosphate-acetyltransferase GlmU-like protein
MKRIPIVKLIEYVASVPKSLYVCLKRLSFQIGDNVWVGTRAVILKGSRVADGCIVGAGSLIAGKFSAHSQKPVFIQRLKTVCRGRTQHQLHLSTEL